MTAQQIQAILHHHYQYLKKTDFRGWDVFDGLNSRLFQSLPFKHLPVARLAWIQLFKRSPINLRPIAGVPKGDNPKALALFISALLNLYKIEKKTAYLSDITQLTARLLSYGNRDYGGIGWGYNFPWQARAFYVPAFKPNMIVSVFVGQALLDLYEYFEKQQYLEFALGIAEFIKESLIIINQHEKTCFGYIPGEQTIVHNANLLGAAYLARLFSVTQIEPFKLLARKAVNFSIEDQREDGAWVYGRAHHHQWIDNFHTGYNLWAIYQYQHFTGDFQYQESLNKGLQFHLQHHFDSDFLPKYTDKSLYPLDIHCFSQAIITFTLLKEYLPQYKEFREKIIRHVLHFMYDTNKNFFYYQKSHRITIKIPYIRWSQAWMFYALVFALKEMVHDNPNH